MKYVNAKAYQHSEVIYNSSTLYKNQIVDGGWKYTGYRYMQAKVGEIQTQASKT